MKEELLNECHEFISIFLGWSIEESAAAIEELYKTPSVLTKKQKFEYLNHQYAASIRHRMQGISELLSKYFKNNFIKKCCNLLDDDCMYATTIFNIYDQYRDKDFQKILFKKYPIKWNKGYKLTSSKSLIRNVFVKSNLENEEKNINKQTFENWLSGIFSNELNPNNFKPFNLSRSVVDGLIQRRFLNQSIEPNETCLEFVDEIGMRAFELTTVRRMYRYDLDFAEKVEERLYKFKKKKTQKTNWLIYLGIDYIQKKYAPKTKRNPKGELLKSAEYLSKINEYGKSKTVSYRKEYYNIEKLVRAGTLDIQKTMEYYTIIPEYKELLLKIDDYFKEKPNE